MWAEIAVADTPANISDYGTRIYAAAQLPAPHKLDLKGANVVDDILFILEFPLGLWARGELVLWNMMGR